MHLSRLLSAFVFTLLLAACTGSATDTPTDTTAVPTQDPLALVADAATRIRGADSFRLTVEVNGPEYIIYTDYGQVLFRRADAQYAAPGVMQSALRVAAAGLTINIDVFAEGADQWYRAIWTANTWLHAAFAPGFDPESLIAEGTGFQAAVDSVTELVDQGETTLENGQSVRHLSGTANGPSMNALLIGLIQMQGQVAVDVYLDTETNMPARFVLVEQVFPAVDPAITPEATDGSETVRGVEPTTALPSEARTWTLDIYDINVPAQFDRPAAEATAETTPEAAVSWFLGVGG